jgi:hypothetical protein
MTTRDPDRRREQNRLAAKRSRARSRRALVDKAEGADELLTRVADGLTRGADELLTLADEIRQQIGQNAVPVSNGPFRALVADDGVPRQPVSPADASAPSAPSARSARCLQVELPTDAERNRAHEAIALIRAELGAGTGPRRPRENGAR